MADAELPEDNAGPEGDTPPEPSAPLSPICRHIRHNGMLLYSAGPPVSDDPERDYSTTVFWCSLSQRGWGPDDLDVGRFECRDASRTCYEPF